MELLDKLVDLLQISYETGHIAGRFEMGALQDDVALEMQKRKIDGRKNILDELKTSIVQLQTENEQLRSETFKGLLVALKEEEASDVAEGLRLMLVKNAPAVICTYCGLAIDNSDVVKANIKMMEHIIDCKKNPLVRALRDFKYENDRMREQLSTIKGLLIDHDSMNETALLVEIAGIVSGGKDNE